MRSFWRWTIPIILVIAAIAATFVIYRLRFAHHEEEHAATVPAEEKAEPGHLKLTAEQAEHAGIKIEKLAAGTLEPTFDLFGSIQEDPGASFTVRGERAGLVEGLPGKNWPDVGETLPDQTPIGYLVVRSVPADQIAIASQRSTLETQLATAQSETNSATAALAAAKASYERLKKLNAQDKNVSDRAVDEAEAKLKGEEARLAGSQQSLKLARSALESLRTDPARPEKMPLVVANGGEVVEVTIHPGEAVEAGQSILRVARFDRILAAVSLPTDLQIPAQAREARIVPIGQETRELTGTRIGTAPTVDPRTKGQMLMFRIQLKLGESSLRPGTPVIAHVRAPGDSLKGVVVPASAVVRYLGKAWVYIATDATSFERREITLDHRAPDGKDWFALQGFKDGDQVVTTGAAVLLSIEVNAAFGGGGD